MVKKVDSRIATTQEQKLFLNITAISVVVSLLDDSQCYLLIVAERYPTGGDDEDKEEFKIKLLSAPFVIQSQEALLVVNHKEKTVTIGQSKGRIVLLHATFDNLFEVRGRHFGPLIHTEVKAI